MASKVKKGGKEMKKTQIDENKLRKELRHQDKSKEKSGDDMVKTTPTGAIDISSKPLEEIRLGGIEG